MRKANLTLPKLIQDYFTKYLPQEKGLSPTTIAAYRDGIKLFLSFSQTELKKFPADLSFKDLNVDLVIAFLNHLEKDRGNLAQSRNHRLAIIKSLVKYIAYRCPEFLGTAQQLLLISKKRENKVMLEFLTNEEMEAILKMTNRNTESGERDFVLFSLMYNTGARVSEVLSLKSSDITYSKPPSVRINGKGRKQRQVPIWSTTAKMMSKWSQDLGVNSPLFTNSAGDVLSRSGVEGRLDILVKKAEIACPSIAKKNVSPHTIRHTTAMHLLEAGVDITMIAMLLGHSHIKTTHGYIEADVKMKAKSLEVLQAPQYRGRKYKPSDSVLAFLEQL